MSARAGLVAAAVGAILAGPSAQASVRYVATNGDDAGAGDAAHPWRSFARATAALKAGDRLVIRAGLYRDTLTLDVSGVPGRPIVVAGEGRPRIVGFEDGVDVKGAWLEVTGLDARATGAGSAIRLAPGAHHVRIAGNVAHDSACAGVGAVGTDHLLIEDNAVFANSRRAPWQCSGISIYQPVAVDDAPGFHNIIRRNRSWNNMNQLVVEAVSHSHGRTTDGNGIIVDDFEHSQSPGRPYRYPTLIEGNIVFDNGGRGVHAFKTRNVAIVGNIAFHDLKDANLQRPAAEISAVMAQNVVVVDNIAVPTRDDPATMDAYAEGADLWDANLAAGRVSWSAIRSSARAGARTVAQMEPGFVRPSIDPVSADFRLRPGAVTRTAGVAVRLLGAGMRGAGLVQIAPGSHSPLGPGFLRLP